jgi:hypothetical protein
MIDSTRRNLIDAIARTPSPTRHRVRMRSAVSYSIAVTWMLGVFSTARATAPIAADGPFNVSMVIGLWIIAAVSTFVVLARGASPLGRSSTTLIALTTLVPGAILGWLLLQPHQRIDPPAPFGWPCLALTIALGAALLASLLVSNRGSDPVHPQWQGAAFGAVAGSWAAMLVAAWCPLFDVGHTYGGHLAPVAILIGAGFSLGKRVLALPARID